MEELFSGFQALTPEFKVVQTDRRGRPRLESATNKTAEEAEYGGSEKPGVKNRSGARERWKKPGEDPREERTVFVGNLPPTITRRRLKQLFGQHGKVESVRLRSMVVEKGRLPVRVAKQKQEQISSSTINSYVVFTEGESAERALELNGAVVGDRHIRVDIATRAKEHAHERSVFVGGLPFAVDDEEFRAVFEKYGDVESVRVVREPKTGNGRGFGFVTFSDRSGVMFALQNSRKMELNGQKLRVMKSKDMSRIQNIRSVAKFSGTQVKPPPSAKSFVKKRERPKAGGTWWKNSGVSRKTLSHSKTGKRQRDGERKIEAKKIEAEKTAEKPPTSGGVRPSRTFHKKKEARRKEREERRKQLLEQRKKNRLKFTRKQNHLKKSDPNKT